MFRNYIVSLNLNDFIIDFTFADYAAALGTL